MLWFERQVVDALLTDVDPQHRPPVVEYVDAVLAEMPEAVRAGVVAETVLLGSWPAVRHRFGRLGPDDIRDLLRRWESSPIGLLRQYVRLLRSLTLFAQCELVPTR